MLVRWFELIQQLKQLSQYLMLTTLNRQIAPLRDNTEIASSFFNGQLEPRIRVQSLGSLAAIVKNTLARRGGDQEGYFVCREWLKQKGMEVQPLIDHINFKKRVAEQSRQTQSQQQESIGHEVMQPILFNHEQFSQKAGHYASTVTLKYLALKRQIRKRHFNAAMGRQGCRPVGEGRVNPKQGTNALVARDKDKRNKYIKVIKGLLQQELDLRLSHEESMGERRSMESDRVARLFYEGVGLKLWSVLYRQVNGVNFSRRHGQVMTELLLNSLLLVQRQLGQDLPVSREALTFHLQQKYLNQLQSGEYEYSYDHGSVWGKIFLLFRGGKVKEAKRLLEKVGDLSLIKLIEMSVEGIVRRQPEKVRTNQHLRKDKANDIFRNQIYYAIGGQRMYSSEALTNPLSLDCVWVLLRNTGIFYLSDDKEFEETRGQMMGYYLQNGLRRELVEYGSYMCAYEKVIEGGEGQALDRDDLVHLLIVLWRYPSLFENKVGLQCRLVQSCVSYAIELAAEGRQQFVFYILMLPLEQLVGEASSLIATNKLYMQVKWQILRKYLPLELFRELMMATSKKHIISSGNYIEAASNMVSLVDAKQEGLQLLTQMLLEQVRMKRIFKEQEVNRALWEYKCWSGNGREVYQRLFQLFESSIGLSKALINYQTNQLRDIVDNKFLIFGDNINFQHSQMLLKLCQNNSIEAFFLYLSTLMRAVNIVYNNHGNYLQNYKEDIYRTARAVIEDSRFTKDCEDTNVRGLVVELSSKMIQQPIRDVQQTN